MTKTTDSGAVTAAVTRYVAFFNGDQPAAAAFADDVTYSAPVTVLHGAAALIDFRDQFREHVAAAEFRAVTEPDTHHDRARLRWEIVIKGERFAAGTDVLTVDGDGRVAAVTTFLDEPPVGFDRPDHH